MFEKRTKCGGDLGSGEVEARLEYVEGAIQIGGMISQVFFSSTNSTDRAA